MTKNPSKEEWQDQERDLDRYGDSDGDDSNLGWAQVACGIEMRYKLRKYQIDTNGK